MLRTEERPLFAAAEERDREIYARCRTVERACAAIGFREDSGYEKVARLVARYTSEHDKNLEKTVREIAQADKVGISERHVRRAIEDLVEFGIISAEVIPPPKHRRRGRQMNIWRLWINWETVRELVAAEARCQEKEVFSASESSADLRTQPRRNPGTTRTEPRHIADKTPAFEDSDLILTQPQNTTAATARKDTNEWAAAAAELEGFVRMPGRVIREACSAGMTESDVIALVRQTKSASVGGGGVLAAIRSGDWVDLLASSQSGPPGPVKRVDAKLAAECIRSGAVRDGRKKLGPDVDESDRRVRAVIVNRLAAAGLSDCFTDEEARTWQRLHESQVV